MAQAPIRAIDRMFDIIETILMHDGAGVSELAAELNMAKSTIHGHLSTLKNRGYLVQDDSNQYHLSLNFLTLGGSVRQKRTVWNNVEPLLREIAQETGESVNFVVESQGDLAFVGLVHGTDGIRTKVDVGFRTNLHTSPEGKLVLAHLPEARRRELLDELEFPLGNSVGRAAFRAELDELRDEGVAYGTETIVKNVATVSVPVIDNKDVFYGAIVVAGPALRFTQDHLEEVRETLTYKVAKLNIDLTFETQESTVTNQIAT